VTPARTITDFRSNSLTEDCGGGAYLQGSISWGSQQWPIGSDGSLAAHYDWTGSETVGDFTYTAESWKITGQFSTATTINGTIALSDTFTYQGGHYSCSGSVTFSATHQG
jgi:glutamine cyclotransferase